MREKDIGITRLEKTQRHLLDPKDHRTWGKVLPYLRTNLNVFFVRKNADGRRLEPNLYGMIPYEFPDMLRN
jgi:hypothetical protein